MSAAASPAPENRSATKRPASAPALKVLLVEDSPSDCELVLRELRKSDFTVSSHAVQTREQFAQQIAENSPDIVLADYNLGEWRGIDTVPIIRAAGLDIPLILVSGALGDVTAVECIKQGATDYVLKDALARLPISIERALKEKQLRRERQRAVDELEDRARDLARSNEELEQFAYVASHDLQEPLRMVASYTQLLGERYRGKLDETADKYIGYAVEGSIRMQTLIQDMLAFSRAGRQGLEVKATDCDLILLGALQSLQEAVRTSKAVVLHEKLPTVTANAMQLQQVFQNLIGNAIKFHGADSPVIQVEAQRQNDNWLFSVSDNGIGIEPHYAEEIFIIFKRLHTRTEYSGNGIGLAICKKIIEQLGGKIWVDNTHKGPGATFKFTLHAAEPQPVPQRTQESKHTNENHTSSAIG